MSQVGDKNKTTLSLSVSASHSRTLLIVSHRAGGYGELLTDVQSDTLQMYRSRPRCLPAFAGPKFALLAVDSLTNKIKLRVHYVALRNL